MMAPLLRTTLAPCGCTPRLEQRGTHRRDKVSVAAALWKTPCGLVRLAYRTYPNQFVDAERYAQFLADVLACRLRRSAVLVVHDRGNMHGGEALESLLADVDRLVGFEPLPPYAPELDPVEELWNWLKYDELPNFAPRDIRHLDRVVNRKLYALHWDQPRLRTFIANSPLNW